MTSYAVFAGRVSELESAPVNQVISGPNCPNCGAQLHGAFCQSCGQKAAIHLGVVDVFHEVGHEFFHLDGKIFATIRCSSRGQEN